MRIIVLFGGGVISAVCASQLVQFPQQAGFQHLYMYAFFAHGEGFDQFGGGEFF